jgi:hypothetical protein
MHQAVAPALGQIDIGDSAVQPMRRANGEVCGAVELLVAPDMVPAAPNKTFTAPRLGTGS